MSKHQRFAPHEIDLELYEEDANSGRLVVQPLPEEVGVRVTNGTGTRLFIGTEDAQTGLVLEPQHTMTFDFESELWVHGGLERRKVWPAE